jgi:hypothetical protein
MHRIGRALDDLDPHVEPGYGIARQIVGERRLVPGLSKTSSDPRWRAEGEVPVEGTQIQNKHGMTNGILSVTGVTDDGDKGGAD